jgi:hypothetical protein
MDNFRKMGQILNYIKKQYYVKDGVFFNKYNIHEYGNEIIRELPKIFSVDREDCIEIFKEWAVSNGIEYLDTDAYGSHKLNVSWSPGIAQDLRSYIHIDAEAELTAMLSEQIATEINAQILFDLRGQLNTNDLLGVIKCVGYEPGPTIYDPETFSPKKHFVSIKKHERENERQNNTHWQDWVRTRGQDEQT